ncbi:hypothetical protein ACFX13_031072 [Malus domestica]
MVLISILLQKIGKQKVGGLDDQSSCQKPEDSVRELQIHQKNPKVKRHVLIIFNLVAIMNGWQKTKDGQFVEGWRWKDLEESDVYDENRRVATMLEVANAKSCSWFNPKKG